MTFNVNYLFICVDVGDTENHERWSTQYSDDSVRVTGRDRKKDEVEVEMSASNLDLRVQQERESTD